MTTRKTNKIQVEAQETLGLLTSSYLRFATFLLSLLTIGLLASMWFTTFDTILDNNAWDTFLNTLRLALAMPLLVLVFIWQVKNLKVVFSKTRQYSEQEIESLRQNSIKAALGGCVAAWGIPLFIVPMVIYVALTLPMLSQLSTKEK